MRFIGIAGEAVMGVIETSRETSSEIEGDESLEDEAADGARGGSDRNVSGNGSVKDTGQCSPANAHWPPCSDLRKAKAS